MEFRERESLEACGTEERRLVQVPTVGEPTRRGWEVALKAMIYFFRQEGFIPQGN